MNFHETIQLQALRLKQLHTTSTDSPEMTEMFIQEAIKQNPAVPLKNICAHISLPLFERVEQTCQLLSLSKRKFVEMALQEALSQADSIVSEVNPFPEEKAA